MRVKDGQNGWKVKTLGSLAKFVNGRGFRPVEWDSTGVPIIRIQNLTDVKADTNYFAGELNPKHRVENGDLLVSWSASLDAYLWDRGTAALNQHIFKVDENANIVDRHFLFHALKAVMDTIRREIHGSTMQHITKPKFEAVEVRVLEDLDAQRDFTEALEERLGEAERLRSALGRQAEAAAALLGASIDEALGGYDVDTGRLGEVFKRLPQAGWSPVCDDAPGGTRVLTLTSVTGFAFRPQAVKLTSEAADPKASYWAHDGDLFVARSNAPDLVGHAAIASGITSPTIFPDLLLRLDLDRERVLPQFVHMWLMGARARRYVRIEAVGSSGSMKKVNQKILGKMPFPTGVGLDVQEKVVEALAEKVDAARDTTRAAVCAVAAADALPAAMLREVFRPAINEEVE